MIGKKYKASSLFILKISEFVYYVPDAEGYVLSGPEFYEHEYYTVALKTGEGEYRDLLALKKYKTEGNVGFGAIRDIDETISLHAFTEFQFDTLSKKEAAEVLKIYLEMLKQQKEKQASEMILCKV